MSASVLNERTSAEQAVVDHDGIGRVDVDYLVNREALSSVFTAQVLAPLSQHDSRINIRLAVFTPIGHRLRRQWRKKMQALTKMASERYGLKMTCLTAPPTRRRGLWSEAGTLRRWLRRQHRRCDPVVLHCRNSGMAQIALDAAGGWPNVRVIFDSRGAEVEEYLQEQRLNPSEMEHWPTSHREHINELGRRQLRVVREAAHVFCVSSAMQQELVETYGLERHKSTVVPCCPDVDRFALSDAIRSEMRRSLSLHDKFVVTYCGSMAWYQLPQEALRIFRVVASLQPQAHFLAVTTQPEVMRGEIARAQIDGRQATVVSVPPPEVPRYLAAGDVGLLLRDMSIVNRVASPVKFGEYLAAGLPVIITEGVGDYSNVVRAHRLGTTISLTDSDDLVRENLQSFVLSHDLHRREMSRRCRAYAVEHLSWSRHLPRVADVYRRLATGDPGNLRS